MIMWLRQSGTMRGVFAAALLFALATRALIPAGFMPTATPYGITMALCSGLNAVDMGLDPDGAPSDDQTAKLCIFAAVNTGLADAPALTLVAPGVVFAMPGHDVVIADPASPRLAAPPPPAIGPPPALS